jgi:drug/metabolite transporter (DMT)-like permease
MHLRPGRPDAIALALFFTCVLLGSGNFLAVRFSNLELPPLWGAGLRFALATVVFALLALGSRRPWPRGLLLRRTIVFGALNFGLFFALMYWSLLFVSASVATIVLATVPLLTLLLAVAQRFERLHWRALAGGGAAFLGIAWMAFSPAAMNVPALPLLALLAAAVTIGQSIILGKHVSGNHPAITNTVAMASGAVLLLLASRAVGETWSWPTLPEARWALLYLVVFGSVTLFALTLLLIRRWTPSATSYAFVVIPVTTLLLEAWLADVPIAGAALVGAGLVMVGVWFGALAPARGGQPADSRAHEAPYRERGQGGEQRPTVTPAGVAPPSASAAPVARGRLLGGEARLEQRGSSNGGGLVTDDRIQDSHGTSGDPRENAEQDLRERPATVDVEFDTGR